MDIVTNWLFQRVPTIIWLPLRGDNRLRETRIVSDQITAYKCERNHLLLPANATLHHVSICTNLTLCNLLFHSFLLFWVCINLHVREVSASTYANNCLHIMWWLLSKDLVSEYIDKVLKSSQSDQERIHQHKQNQGSVVKRKRNLSCYNDLAY